MNEVTKWDGKPRYMWVWDNNENKKVKAYVICILTEEEMNEGEALYPVRTVGTTYEHCAEIEEKSTRLTNYELSQLLKCFGVEWYPTNVYIHNDVLYECKNANKEVPTNIKIHYKQGEWEEPTRETVWKWWCKESPDSDIARFVSFIGWGEDKE